MTAKSENFEVYVRSASGAMSGIEDLAQAKARFALEDLWVPLEEVERLLREGVTTGRAKELEAAIRRALLQVYGDHSWREILSRSVHPEIERSAPGGT